MAFGLLDCHPRYPIRFDDISATIGSMLTTITVGNRFYRVNGGDHIGARFGIGPIERQFRAFTPIVPTEKTLKRANGPNTDTRVIVHHQGVHIKLEQEASLGSSISRSQPRSSPSESIRVWIRSNSITIKSHHWAVSSADDGPSFNEWKSTMTTNKLKTVESVTNGKLLHRFKSGWAHSVNVFFGGLADSFCHFQLPSKGGVLR